MGGVRLWSHAKQALSRLRWSSPAVSHSSDGFFVAACAAIACSMVIEPVHEQCTSTVAAVASRGGAPVRLRCVVAALWLDHVAVAVAAGGGACGDYGGRGDAGGPTWAGP